MTRADIDAMVSDSARSLRREETLAWVLPACITAFGFACAVAMALFSAPADAAETITFPAHVGYRAERWAPTTGNRIKVCPLPTPVPACLLGDGWIDPDDVSPIPGYWLRHLIVRADGAVVLFFCRDGQRCEGDE